MEYWVIGSPSLAAPTTIYSGRCSIRRRWRDSSPRTSPRLSDRSRATNCSRRQVEIESRGSLGDNYRLSPSQPCIEYASRLNLSGIVASALAGRRSIESEISVSLNEQDQSLLSRELF